ncbi:elongation factor P--(R)-beta-lysine ligase [Hydrogenivirga sp.]
MLIEKWDEFINIVRGFFRERGYIEVSTPVLLRHPNLDSNVEPIQVRLRLRGGEELRWLQTSPEYSMKKLLSRYRKSIFQVAKVFRNDEHGRLHRPEFHMLEWYRIGATYRELMEEIRELLRELLGWVEFEEVSMKDAFGSLLGVNLTTDKEDFKEELRRAGIEFAEDEDWETIFFRAFLELERKLTDKPTFLTHFPEPLSALARVDEGYAQRFELFVRGVEIANGWTEETDMNEVRRRLEREAKRRNLPLDEDFIKAHKNMPPSAGCSIGLERLFMFYVGKESLDDIELFT